MAEAAAPSTATFRHRVSRRLQGEGSRRPRRAPDANWTHTSLAVGLCRPLERLSRSAANEGSDHIDLVGSRFHAHHPDHPTQLRHLPRPHIGYLVSQREKEGAFSYKQVGTLVSVRRHPLDLHCPLASAGHGRAAPLPEVFIRKTALAGASEALAPDSKERLVIGDKK